MADEPTESTTSDGIRVNRHALRFDGVPAGWLVVFANGEVNNTIFRTEEDALKHARTVHPSHGPWVKAVRWEAQP